MKETSTNPSGRSTEALLLDFGKRIFQNPHCLVQAHCHGFVRPLSITRHKHKDLLQLDFNYGFAGHAVIGDQRIEIQNITALVFYPGELHEIELKPAQRDAKVFSIKIQVDSRSLAIRNRLFPRLIYRSIADHRLLRALTRLVRLAMVSTSRTSVQCTTLMEVMCYWPLQENEEYRCEIWSSEEEIGKGMNAALNLIDNRLKDPPSLEELAAVAFMSPRNFVRRFRAMFSCAPHQYITARRLAWARELLSEGQLNVTEISEQMGFPSIHIFSRWFRRETQASPSSYREQSQLL